MENEPISQEDIEYWKEFMGGDMDEDDIMDILIALAKEQSEV